MCALGALGKYIRRDRSAQTGLDLLATEGEGQGVQGTY